MTLDLTRRALASLTLILCLLPQGLAAQTGLPDTQLFRIGSGGTSGLYYPIGRLLAEAISNPHGGAPCDQGGACGVPGLLATAMESAGSVANIEALTQGRLESALVQADIASWAQHGSAPRSALPQADGLRAIARLFPEAVHLVARRDAGIATLSDLRGKRLSLDQPGSGTMVDADLILQAAGLSRDELHLTAASAEQAAELLAQDRLDAFFFVGGWPAPMIARLAASTDISLVPIRGPDIAALAASQDVLQAGEIPAEIYHGQPTAVPTLMVGALWVTTADQPEDLIHAITRVLWNDFSMALLNAGPDAARLIHRDSALDGVPIPLHPGAARYYREAGLLAP